MSSVIDALFEDIQAAGIQVQIDPPDLIVSPVDRLTPDLEGRLRQHKAEILDRLKLKESMRRLEADGVLIAVWEDGSMRVVVAEAETVQAIDDGGTIYCPQDMYYYVQLEPDERRTLQEFKKRYGGETEWKVEP